MAKLSTPGACSALAHALQQGVGGLGRQKANRNVALRRVHALALGEQSAGDGGWW